MGKDLAAEVIQRGDPGEILAMAMRARCNANEGIYCECAEPITFGVDLLCGACLLNNRDQERAAVRRIVEAHDFVLREKTAPLPMCAVCSCWEDAPRHHGVAAVGRTSWGEEVRV